MPTQVRHVRVPDIIWQPALHTAEQQGEALSEVIREALEVYIGKHVAPRLVRLKVGAEHLGIDPLTIRNGGPEAMAYRWSPVKGTYAWRGRIVTLTAEQAAEVVRHG